MQNWIMGHPFLTLIWLASGLIAWAWANFNIEINVPKQNKGITKYATLIGMLAIGPLSLIPCLVLFVIVNFWSKYKFKFGLKFN